jgi:hypothetical protein
MCNNKTYLEHKVIMLYAIMPLCVMPLFSQASIGFLCKAIEAKLGSHRAKVRGCLPCLYVNTTSCIDTVDDTCAHQVPATHIAFGIVPPETFRDHVQRVMLRVMKYHGGDGNELLGEFCPRGPGMVHPLAALPSPKPVRKPLCGLDRSPTQQGLHAYRTIKGPLLWPSVKL